MPIESLPIISEDPLPEIGHLWTFQSVNPIMWINSSTITIIIVSAAATGVIYKLCQNPKKIRFFKKKPQNREPKQIELKETHAKDPHRRISLYPDLQQDMDTSQN